MDDRQQPGLHPWQHLPPVGRGDSPTGVVIELPPGAGKTERLARLLGPDVSRLLVLGGEDA